ncbi:OLC1v1024491C1 [Oldenlandia corymbosa var. corymbosa]|uniref:OLC1v1024491C1 n=1 Tax=Oldenlandia corymbosa var. corymbosa TaxID=529605 RepID=A0AAV1C5B2_OLDCO|nr:OLC1v1024491C1 [Oldenlandia corymbosa var. corymbosa]
MVSTRQKPEEPGGSRPPYLVSTRPTAATKQDARRCRTGKQIADAYKGSNLQKELETSQESSHQSTGRWGRAATDPGDRHPTRVPIHDRLGPRPAFKTTSEALWRLVEKEGDRRQRSPNRKDTRGRRWSGRGSGKGDGNNREDHDKAKKTPPRNTPLPAKTIIHDIPLNAIFCMPLEVQSITSAKVAARPPPPGESDHNLFKPSETITFSADYAVTGPPSSVDALVISAIIHKKEVRRVYVDPGSGVNVIYQDCFQKLGIDKSQLRPCAMPLMGFSNHIIIPTGMITLSVTVGEYPTCKTELCDFAVVDVVAPFNILLGRPWMNQVKVIFSSYHLVMKFPTDYGIAEVRGDRQLAHQCMSVAARKGKQALTSANVNQVLLSSTANETATPYLEVIPTGQDMAIPDLSETMARTTKLLATLRRFL